MKTFGTRNQNQDGVVIKGAFDVFTEVFKMD